VSPRGRRSGYGDEVYELPADFDVQVFATRVLERVTFTANTLELIFDGEVSVTVESKIRYEVTDDGGGWVESATVPLTESTLMRLIGRRVHEASVKDRSSIALKFDNDHVLLIIADSDQYECYQLQIGDAEIVV
jgi:Family of unknown function (DUF6188)